APPARAVAPPAHAKMLNVSETAMLFPAVPAVAAVTVTTAPLELAVAVEAETFLLIAAARFAASVVVSVDVAKLAPVLVPSVPPVSAPPAHENPLNVVASVM